MWRREELTALYERFAPRLYREVLFPRLGQRAAAEDALAETFRTLIEKSDTLALDKAGLWPWLATVASNKANDMHRAKGRTGRALANLEGMLAPLRAPASDGADTLEHKEEQRLLEAAVEKALGALNPRYRRAIELRFFQEQPREACATALEVSVETFDVLLCRALKSFRKEWAP